MISQPIGREALHLRATDLMSNAVRALHAMRGQRIVRVLYYGLRYDQEQQWDYGEWHDPETGVELWLANGAVCSAVWGQRIAHFELDLILAPMTTQLVRAGEPDGPRVWEVTQHPAWANLLLGPVVDAHLLMDSKQDFASSLNESVPLAVPLALQLEFTAGVVWIAAGEPEYPRNGVINLGMDGVVATFKRQSAAAIGLMSLTPWAGARV